MTEAIKQGVQRIQIMQAPSQHHFLAEQIVDIVKFTCCLSFCNSGLQVLVLLTLHLAHYSG